MGFKYVETRQMVSLVVDILIATEFSNDETNWVKWLIQVWYKRGKLAQL